jgi:hypothetical protein
MICRGPGVIVVVLFGSFPTPSPPTPVSKLSLFLIFVCFAGRASSRERMRRGWVGAKSYDGENAWSQNVFNVLQRTKLSRYHMIWLLPPPPPRSPVSKVSLFLRLTVCSRSSLLTGEGEKGVKSYNSEKVWSSIMHIKSFNTLWGGGWGGGVKGSHSRSEPAALLVRPSAVAS